MIASNSKKYIPGPTEGTFMVTDKAYTPFMQETIVDNKLTLETKSTWVVKGAFMSGPFINYAIKDEINKRIRVFTSSFGRFQFSVEKA